jgi:hypothetical protein
MLVNGSKVIYTAAGSLLKSDRLQYKLMRDN